ncbi:MAG: hypothetical protein K6A44_02215 [bacterium]|nr:hypothetical protein [bacterium]
MKISFGAKLITTPEQFSLQTDNIEDKRHVSRFVNGLKVLVENPVFNSLTENDTIELKRAHSRKGKFNYKIIYKSPEIKDIDSFEHITMEIGNKLGLNEVFGAFEQISYAPMYKKGVFSDEEYSLSDSYDDLFLKTFKMSFSDFLKALASHDKKD